MFRRSVEVSDGLARIWSSHRVGLATIPVRAARNLISPKGHSVTKNFGKGLAVAALVAASVAVTPLSAHAVVTTATSSARCSIGFSQTGTTGSIQRSGYIYNCSGATYYQPRVTCLTTAGTPGYFYGAKITSGTSTANCPVGYALVGLTVLFT
jgi:hypothetical protein